jgi:hypothetical protein
MTIWKRYSDHGLVGHDKSNDVYQVSVFRGGEAVEGRREGKTANYMTYHRIIQPSNNGPKIETK